MNDEKLYWIGFNLIRGIGAARYKALLGAFGSLQEAWNAAPQSLQQAGLSARLSERVIQARTEVSLERVWDDLQSNGIQALTWEDEDYPRRLKELDQAPPVLYLRGGLLPADDWSVAVVGTRRVTPYGRQVAQEISRALVANGITVVSGLARGVDAVAHQSALDAGGRTLAVLGNGVDRVYPPEHRRLAEQIMKQGALISDYPLGTMPEASNFPPRNRIVSGISLAVVVVEAGERSGALITANFAAEQGRDVFAVPGNINAPQSVGANRLIQKGAHPYVSVADLLEVLDLTFVIERQAARQDLPVDGLEARLVGLLAGQPLHIDEISRQAALPVAQVSATLTMMELKGLVKSVGGMNYVALREPQANYRA